MRKTFVKFFAGALALLAMSSCGKIWDEFDSVHGELDALSARIDELEEKLNTEVATLNNAISTIKSSLADVQGDVEALAAELTAAGLDIDKLEKAVADNKAAIEDNDAAIKANADKIAANGVDIEALKLADAENLEAMQKALADAKAEVVKALEELQKSGAAADDAQSKKYEELLAKLTEVEGELTAAIADIAVVDVTEEGGVIVLTLANGSKINVSAPLTNVENTNLVTTVEVDGVKYWAVVGADGKVTSLDVVVGHPVDFVFDIDAETGYMRFSIDGGETFKETDVLFTGAADTDDLVNIVTGFEDNETYVTITIGETEYTLPKYGVDNTMLIKAGKTVFKYGETKQFDIAIEGVGEFYVMTKPDGWKASVSGKVLTVTAPVEANVYAELSGDVLLHGCNAYGQCLVAKLAVTAAAEGVIEFIWNPETDEVTINHSYLSEVQMYDPLEGFITGLDFAQLMVGFADIDTWESMGTKAYLESIYNYEIEGISAYLDNNNDYPFDSYDPETYPVKTFTSTVEDLYVFADWRAKELPLGSKYVVWVAPYSMDGINTDEAAYFYYAPVTTNVTVTETTHNDATLDVALYGADSYFVGKVPETYFADYGYTFDEYMNTQMSGSPWQAIIQGYGEYYCGTVAEDGTMSSVALSEFGLMEGEEAAGLMPNTTYYVFVVPVIDGKDWSDYVYETDCRVVTVKTASLVSGGAATVDVTASTSTFSQIKATMTVTGEFETLYYKWYLADEYNAMTEEAVIADLCKTGYQAIDSEVSAMQNVTASGQPDSYILVAFASDATGKYGTLMEETLSATAVPYTTDYAVTLASSVYDATAETYTVTFNVTGGATKIYVQASSGAPRLQYDDEYDYYLGQFDDRILNNYTNYLYSTDVVDGKATVVYPVYSTRKHAYVVAYSVDADNNISALTKAVQIDVVTPATPAE